MNRKKIPLLVLCGLALFAGALPLAAISPDDFNTITFVNKLSGNRDIEYLFFSPGDSQYWGPDILNAAEILGNGKEISFYLFYPDASGRFDFMAVDSAGRVYETDTVTVSDGKAVTVTINDAQLTDRVFSRMPMVEVIIENQTSTDLDFVFFAPADSRVWGLEVLNAGRSLLAGEETSFLVLLAGENFRMELLALGADGKEYQRSIGIGGSAQTLHLQLNAEALVKP